MNGANGVIGVLPFRVRAAMLLRLFAVQGSWNYEQMLGTGLGYALEPALRLLPGGKGGEAYRQAVARHTAYFNSHPYMTSLAAGALARAELNGVPPDRISRFRTALCGPLGSLGDRLVWSALLPVCSLLALVLFGAGVRPVLVTIVFFLAYNSVHLFLRIWGLSAGWRHGMQVVQALGNPVLRRGPGLLARVGAVLAGISLSFAVHRLVDGGPLLTTSTLAVAFAGAVLLVNLKGRVQGWSAALTFVAAYALLMVLL